MAEKPGSAISRREFARRAALASAIGSAVVSIGPTGAVGAGIAATARQPSESANQAPIAPSVAAAQAQLPANMPRLSPESQAEADARFQAILAQYGARFSEEQKTDLHRLCVLAQPPLEHLRAYPVQNGDGTALYLKPLFERERSQNHPPRPHFGAARQAVATPRPHPAPRKNPGGNGGCPPRNSFTCRLRSWRSGSRRKQVSPPWKLTQQTSSGAR